MIKQFQTHLHDSRHGKCTSDQLLQLHDSRHVCMIPDMSNASLLPSFLSQSSMRAINQSNSKTFPPAQWLGGPVSGTSSCWVGYPTMVERVTKGITRCNNRPRCNDVRRSCLSKLIVGGVQVCNGVWHAMKGIRLWMSEGWVI